MAKTKSKSKVKEEVVVADPAPTEEVIDAGTAAPFHPGNHGF